MSLAKNDEIKFYRPQNISELDLIVKTSKEKLTFVAGATDLMVLEHKWQNSKNLVDLTCVKELSQKIETHSDGILIGAAVPMSDIVNHSLIKEKFPILVEALKQVGSEQIQNRATLGGNIANASPAGDSLPLLTVLDADILIGPPKNGRFGSLKMYHLHCGPGKVRLGKKDYIAHIFLPFPREKNQFWYFRKVGQRKAMAISKVSLAVFGWITNGFIEEIRISPGAITPRIGRALMAEAILNGRVLDKNQIEEAKQAIEKFVKPISDIRSNIEYRRKICGELLRQALYQVYL